MRKEVCPICAKRGDFEPKEIIETRKINAKTELVKFSCGHTFKAKLVKIKPSEIKFGEITREIRLQRWQTRLDEIHKSIKEGTLLRTEDLLLYDLEFCILYRLFVFGSSKDFLKKSLNRTVDEMYALLTENIEYSEIKKDLDELKRLIGLKKGFLKPSYSTQVIKQLVEHKETVEMVRIEEIKELDQIIHDLEKINCRVKIHGGMKKRGESEHDLDLVVRIIDRSYEPRLHDLLLLLQKWNRIMLEKYDLGLDVIIQNRRKKHIYDFDWRPPFGFIEVDYPRRILKF